MRPCNCPRSQLVCGTTRTQILQLVCHKLEAHETTWPGFLCPDLVSISWHGVINYFFCTFTLKVLVWIVCYMVILYFGGVRGAVGQL